MKEMQHEPQVQTLGWEDPLEKDMANTCIKHLPNCALYMQFIICKLYLNKAILKNKVKKNPVIRKKKRIFPVRFQVQPPIVFHT